MSAATTFSLTGPTLIPYIVGVSVPPYIRIRSLRANASIVGINGPRAGATLLIINAANTALTIRHESRVVNTALRCNLFNAVDMVMASNTVTSFFYDINVQRWVQATEPGANAFRSIGVSGQNPIVAGNTTSELTLIAADSHIVLTSNAANDTITIQATGFGNVSGPASATDRHVAFFNGTTGKLIKDSGLTLSGTNTGDQTMFGTVEVSGQANLVATTANTILTFAAGTNITLTTNASTGTVTIAVTANTNYSWPEIGTVSITDSSAHVIGNIANKAGVLLINSTAGTTTIPFYPNGGRGVAFAFTILNPTSDWVIDSTSISFSFTDGSSLNTYTVSIASGNGNLSVQRTSGSTNYTAAVYGA